MHAKPPRSHRPGRGIAAFLGFWLALTLSAGLGAAPRIVAVGDVHGDVEGLREILQQAGVVNATGGWAGGDAILVQVGDLIDRGPRMRGTLDFVMDLERAAAKAGGRVVAVLGNHEVMNLAGDLRYVTPGNYAEFAGPGSEALRTRTWKQLRDFRKRRARQLGLPEPAPGREARDAWLQAHPPGYLEQREAFGPEGAYGRWLRERPAYFVEQETAFMHGGLSPESAGVSLEEVGLRVRRDLARLDADRARFVAEGLILPFFDLAETLRAVREELDALTAAGAARPAPADEAERRAVYQRFLDWGSWTMNSADGPLWFRGFARWSDAEGEAEMPRLLKAAGVQRFVVGHTPQEDGRIRVRFDGAVFLIDTGLLAAYMPGGRRSALQISDGVVSAIYSGESPRVLWEPLRPAASAPRTAADTGA